MLVKARLVAGRRIARKYRQVHLKALQRLEYKRLRDMVPWLRHKSQMKKKISKVQIIENTIIYIDQLHKALAEKIHQQQADDDLIGSREAGQIARLMFVERNEASVGKTLSKPNFPSSYSSPSAQSITSSLSSSSTATKSSCSTNTSGRWNVCMKERMLPSYLVQSKVLHEMSDSYNFNNT